MDSLEIEAHLNLKGGSLNSRTPPLCFKSSNTTPKIKRLKLVEIFKTL